MDVSSPIAAEVNAADPYQRRLLHSLSSAAGLLRVVRLPEWFARLP